MVICEDEGITVMQLRRALTHAGLTVVGAAPNGVMAVDMVLREHPDIVLMDIRMPLMDGIEAARRIMESHPVCIVMLTAFSTDDYRTKASEIGACGYVLKPVSTVTLLPHLEAAFEKFNNPH